MQQAIKVMDHEILVKVIDVSGRCASGHRRKVDNLYPCNSIEMFTGFAKSWITVQLPG